MSSSPILCDFASLRETFHPMIEKTSHSENVRIDRRTLLVTGGVAVAGLAAAPWLRDATRPRASVFVARHQKYDGPLATTIRDGLVADGREAASVSSASGCC